MVRPAGLATVALALTWMQGCASDVRGAELGGAPPLTAQPAGSPGYPGGPGDVGGASPDGAPGSFDTPAPGDGGNPAPSIPRGPDLCQLEASQVAVLGDSYVALDPSFILLDTQPFARNLEALAQDAGALGQGEQYRRLAVSGASMKGWPNIPSQLDTTLEQDPDLKLIVMTGGGNEMLIFNRGCLEYPTEAELAADARCVQVVEDAIAEGQRMFDRAAEAGVGAIVYFFYPNLPGLANGGIGAGTHPNVMLEYALPRVQALCERQQAAPCHFVDMRPAFDQDGNGLPDPGLINIDGIHPTAAASELLASEVWAVMQEHCLASEAR